MKTLFITAGPITWASSRLRCHWPAAYMDADVVTFEDRSTVDCNPYDAFVFQKSFAIDDAQQVQAAGKRVYWDLCDPLHWFIPDKVRAFLPYVDGVICSNEALTTDFVDWSDGKVPTYTIPDRLEPNAYPLRHVHEDTDPVRFIWYGISANRVSLYGALTNLERLSANGHAIALTLFDDTPGQEFASGSFPVYYTRWSLTAENDVISSHDIALLPPYPGPWGKVKSNNKCLTAWACGLPVTDGNDYADLVRLVEDAEYRQSLADEGMDALCAGYDVRQSAREWEAILCK